MPEPYLKNHYITCKSLTAQFDVKVFSPNNGLITPLQPKLLDELIRLIASYPFSVVEAYMSTHQRVTPKNVYHKSMLRKTSSLSSYCIYCISQKQHSFGDWESPH